MNICILRVLLSLHNQGASPIVWNHLSYAVLLNAKRTMINGNNNENEVLGKQFDE